ncbi:hypothetical protein BO86DRAFT_404708 [Aspergillus japonicus CBS 114.51]|uniref:F-box domain-containing protein n=1 Tax=Aspergillus japonicus CBS 114.51 TaxID=1448312 RepID=A0A8T8WL68_ASPJA|nr:hypothetical protein BO86DRAFT_404708 [Aspergillus japonicus CBS 114.51]RAH76402.1 hypothetical protein BO86DRAFT_404708 [Aspergillus japonicus CBS 114.51]
MAPATNRLLDPDVSLDSGMQSAKMLVPEISLRPEASAIFFIPEILELIFLNVDMYTILMSKHVCSAWKDLIQTSPKIRKVLAFASLMINSDELRNVTEFLAPHGGITLHGGLPQTSDGPPIRPCTCHWRLRDNWRTMLLQNAPSSRIRVRCPGIPYGHNRAFCPLYGPHGPYNCLNRCHIEISSAIDALPRCGKLEVGVVLECPKRGGNSSTQKLYIIFRVLPQGDSEDYLLDFNGWTSIEDWW